ncbi:MAG: substrate-binding periplasmic protein [Candidatus Chromulinivorax sp.]
MKPIFTLLSTLFILTACYFLYKTNTIALNQTKDYLIVGTSADYPPYAQIDLATQKIVGFEIDVITAIAEKLDKTLILKDMPFNALILELMSGHIDVIAAGLSPSPQRSKAVLFSIPYIKDDNLIVVSTKNHPCFEKLEDLYGKTVAVNIGYTSDTFLSKYPQINLIRLKSTADSIIALQSGSVDAFATSKSSFEILISKQKENSDYYQYFQLPASADSCALAFEKNNHQLQKEIDPIITAMLNDGTMQSLKEKWGLA